MDEQLEKGGTVAPSSGDGPDDFAGPADSVGSPAEADGWRRPDEPGWGAATPPRAEPPPAASEPRPSRASWVNRMFRFFFVVLLIFMIFAAIGWYRDAHSAHPTARDVSLTSCAHDNDHVWATGTIVNHTSKTSDYYVSVEFRGRFFPRPFATDEVRVRAVASGAAHDWTATGRPNSGATEGYDAEKNGGFSDSQCSIDVGRKASG